ncbi:MAG: lamin tail domain-containing protein [Bacteroidota bacterium]
MSAFVRLLCLCVSILAYLPLWGQLQINEFMAINRSYELTTEKLTVDWIELFNPDSQNVQLQNYYLTDELEELTKYKLPNLTVPGKGYRVLFQGEDNLLPNRSFPFGLAGEGEFLALVAPDGITIIDSISFGPQYPDQAFGRAENGNKWGIMAKATAGEANSSLKALLPLVEFSLPSGIYTEDSLWVEIWVADSAAKIYYTLDGNEPDSNDRLYERPLLLSESHTIRAKALRDSASSPISSFATYLLQEPKKHLILNLHGPDKWFFSLDSGLLKISKFELGSWATSNPFNYLVDAELFDGNGVLRSRHQGRLRQHGAGSTYGQQKSMRLHLSPSQAITGPLFRQKPEIQNHRIIILRQGGNFSDWTGLAVNDVLSSEYLSRKGWDLDYQAYQPVNVYINGKFHALMFFRERHDQHYYANNLQADPDKVSVVRKFGFGAEFDTGEGLDFNSINNFVQSNNFLDTNDVYRLAERVDLDNYFKYLYFNDFIGNGDWPFNNFKLAFTGGEGDKWRFCVYDNDFAYQNYQVNGIASLMNDGDNGYWLPRMLKNDSLKEYFINYYLDLLNTEFIEEEFAESVDYIKRYLEPDVRAHLTTWKSRLQNGSISNQDWDIYLNTLKSGLPQYKNYARRGLATAFFLGAQIPVNLAVTPSSAGSIQLNTLDLQDLPWTGTYLQKNHINIEAIPRPGYRFVGWSDPLLPQTPKLRYELETFCNLTAFFEKDSSYQPELVLNEIMYADDPSRGGGDWIELYNASEESMDLSQWVLGDETSENRYAFPPGTLLSAKEYLVVCRDPAAFLGAFPGTDISPVALGFGLGKEDAVRLWNPDGLLVDSVIYSNQAPWPTIADGKGASLALRDPQLKVSYPQNWIRREDYRPTPGAQNDFIVETEITNRLSCVRFDAQLFPNPMSTEFNLYFTNSNTENIDLQFFDLLGRSIHQETVPLRLGANLVQIPVDFLPQGHYILQLSQDGMMETVRIVKN